MSDLSIIIVNTNELHFLKPCLQSIFRETTGIKFEVIVVDNASSDGTREWVAKEFPDVKVVRNERNLGFAAANNRGIMYSKGRLVLLLNPDTEILNGALQKSVDLTNRNPDVGVLGCKLLSAAGAIQPSVRGFPNFWNLFFETTFLYLAFPNSKFVGRYYMSYFKYDTTIEVDWLCGAFFLIRRELLDKIGVLDERFFMYAEELDYCYRTRKEGYRVLFFSDASVIHHWGIGTTNPKLVYWGHKSQILFFKKHWDGLTLIAFVFLKLLGVFLRVVFYSIAGLLTVNRRLLLKASLNGRAFLKLMTEG